MNQTPYDIVYLLGLLGGVVFSNPVIAQAVAPYAAIFFAALVGSMFSLSRRKSDTRSAGARFMFKIVGTALIVTVPAASWVAPHLGFSEARLLFAPFALLIGAVGEDWGPFLGWCLSFFNRFKSGSTEGKS